MIFSFGISGNAKPIASLMCVLQILMQLPTFIGNQKRSFFPMNMKRRRNISKHAWINAVISLPLWFHAMECLQRKPRQFYKTLQEASPRNQESPILKLQTSWSQEWALQLYVPHIFAFVDHASLQAAWANTHSGKMQQVSVYSTITRNSSQLRLASCSQVEPYDLQHAFNWLNYSLSLQ